jgi:hypothetical protein
VKGTTQGRTTRDTGPWALVPEWVLDADISDRAVRLYALLGRYADGEGESYPGRKTLAERLRCSLNSLDRAGQELVAAGALDVTPRKRDDGSQASNLYTLRSTPPVGRGGPTDGEGGSRTGGEPRTRTTRNESATTSTEVAAPGVPPSVRVDGRNLVMDAVANECGVDQASPRYREVVAAVNGTRGRPGIRALAWRDLAEYRLEGADLERAIVRLVIARAEQYRGAMSGAMLTPPALAKWWVDLPKMATTGGDAIEALRVAEDELRKMGRIQ